MRMIDVLMLIKTSDLEFDDRLKKEALTLTGLGKSVAIRAILQNNISERGQIFKSIKFKTFRLLTRDLLPQGKYLAVKALEMYSYFVLSILRLKPEIVWVHNIEMIGIFPILNTFKKIRFIKRIVWDQHELPPERYFQSSKLKKNLQRAYNISDVIIAANGARLSLIKNSFKVLNGKVILNLPYSTFISAKRIELHEKYQKWCNNRQYFITTGLIDDSLRYIAKISEAIMQFEKYCLIVMGPYSKDTINAIEITTEKQIDKKILFTGMITQNEIINLTDHAFASIVLYNSDKINNKYCAPNRLYQAVVRGIPLITGNNPPLADFIKEYKAGYIINSDGRDVDEIVKSINHMEGDRNFYISNISKIRTRFTWEANNSVIDEICSIKKA